MTTDMIVKLCALLIPILVPLVLRGVKAAIPRMPTWVVPVLAPVIGAISAGLGSVTTGVSDPGTAMMVGSVLGLAGSGVREIGDQGAKAVVATSEGKPLPRVDDEKK